MKKLKKGSKHDLFKYEGQLALVGVLESDFCTYDGMRGFFDEMPTRMLLPEPLTKALNYYRHGPGASDRSEVERRIRALKKEIEKLLTHKHVKTPKYQMEIRICTACLKFLQNKCVDAYIQEEELANLRKASDRFRIDNLKGTVLTVVGKCTFEELFKLFLYEDSREEADNYDTPLKKIQLTRAARRVNELIGQLRGTGCEPVIFNRLAKAYADIIELFRHHRNEDLPNLLLACGKFEWATDDLMHLFKSHRANVLKSYVDAFNTSEYNALSHIILDEIQEICATNYEKILSLTAQMCAAVNNVAQAERRLAGRDEQVRRADELVELMKELRKVLVEYNAPKDIKLCAQTILSAVPVMVQKIFRNHINMAERLIANNDYSAPVAAQKASSMIATASFGAMDALAPEMSQFGLLIESLVLVRQRGMKKVEEGDDDEDAMKKYLMKRKGNITASQDDNSGSEFEDIDSSGEDDEDDVADEDEEGSDEEENGRRSSTPDYDEELSKFFREVNKDMKPKSCSFAPYNPPQSFSAGRKKKSMDTAAAAENGLSPLSEFRAFEQEQQKKVQEERLLKTPVDTGFGNSQVPQTQSSEDEEANEEERAEASSFLGDGKTVSEAAAEIPELSINTIMEMDNEELGRVQEKLVEEHAARQKAKKIAASLDKHAREGEAVESEKENVGPNLKGNSGDTSSSNQIAGQGGGDKDVSESSTSGKVTAEVLKLSLNVSKIAENMDDVDKISMEEESKNLTDPSRKRRKSVEGVALPGSDQLASS
ncbi:unnamed protein product [Amoebophrya sp. A25]|nr:unnamed protein product [Amoebophrya sp. A25]|eukprot:GSA25T00026711001.1